MIASLSGLILHKEPSNITLDVRGVGYEITLSSRTLDKLPGLGKEVFLHIQMNVREDAITLYGFSTTEEKNLFLLLNTISGVGPKLAMGILSGISGEALCEAITMKDIPRLTTLSGVGKKTAQRICVELQDKIGQYFTSSGSTGLAGTSESGQQISEMQDAASALTNLGYPQEIAWEALKKIRLQANDPETLTMEELIRGALKTLA